MRERAREGGRCGVGAPGRGGKTDDAAGLIERGGMGRLGLPSRVSG